MSAADAREALELVPQIVHAPRALRPSLLDGAPSVPMLECQRVGPPGFTLSPPWLVAASSDLVPLRPLTVEFTESSDVCTDEHMLFADTVGDVVFDDVLAPLVVVVEELARRRLSPASDECESLTERNAIRSPASHSSVPIMFSGPRLMRGRR